MNQFSRQQQLKFRKRSDIIAAGVLEFQQCGFQGTSMDRIAARAKVSKRTIYNHFQGKDDFFAAIVDSLVDRCTGIEFSYSADEPLDRQLVSLGTKYAHVMTGEDFMQLSRVVLSRVIQHPRHSNSHLRGQGDMLTTVTDFMQQARDDGRLTITSPERAAVQYTSMINSFAFWPQLISNHPPLNETELDRVVRDASKIMLSHFATDQTSSAILPTKHVPLDSAAMASSEMAMANREAHD